jgi:hypothetical protein
LTSTCVCVCVCVCCIHVGQAKALTHLRTELDADFVKGGEGALILQETLLLEKEGTFDIEMVFIASYTLQCANWKWCNGVSN